MFIQIVFIWDTYSKNPDTPTLDSKMAGMKKMAMKTMKKAAMKKAKKVMKKTSFYASAEKGRFPRRVWIEVPNEQMASVKVAKDRGDTYTNVLAWGPKGKELKNFRIYAVDKRDAKELKCSGGNTTFIRT